MLYNAAAILGTDFSFSLPCFIFSLTIAAHTKLSVVGEAHWQSKNYLNGEFGSFFMVL